MWNNNNSYTLLHLIKAVQCSGMRFNLIRIAMALVILAEHISRNHELELDHGIITAINFNSKSLAFQMDSQSQQSRNVSLALESNGPCRAWAVQRLCSVDLIISRCTKWQLWQL